VKTIAPSEGYLSIILPVFLCDRWPIFANKRHETPEHFCCYNYSPDEVGEESYYSVRSKQMDSSGEPGQCSGLPSQFLRADDVEPGAFVSPGDKPKLSWNRRSRNCPDTLPALFIVANAPEAGRAFSKPLRPWRRPKHDYIFVEPAAHRAIPRSGPPSLQGALSFRVHRDFLAYSRSKRKINFRISCQFDAEDRSNENWRLSGL
jgi:hypothetical protein